MFGLSKLRLMAYGAVLAIIGGLAFMWWLNSHELANCRAQQAALIQAEKTTTDRAKAEQKQADAESKRQKREIAQRATKATAQASVIAAQARSTESGVVGKVNKIASHKRSVKAWQQTPIPASVLKAIGGGQ